MKQFLENSRKLDDLVEKIFAMEKKTVLMPVIPCSTLRRLPGANCKQLIR